LANRIQSTSSEHFTAPL